MEYLDAIYGENEEFRFQNKENKKLLLHGVRSSNLSGKELGNINDLILRSFEIKEEEDRHLILSSLQTLMAVLDPDLHDDDHDDHDDHKEDKDTEDRQCIFCMDQPANMMFMPCNHIALCQDCCASNTFEKCAFCGDEYEKVIKCYHIGF